MGVGVEFQTPIEGVLSLAANETQIVKLCSIILSILLIR